MHFRSSVPLATWFAIVVRVLALCLALGPALLSPRSLALSSPVRRDWVQIVARYRDEVSRNPSSVDAHFRLAVAYAHEGKLLDGWEHLKQVDHLLGGERRRAPAARAFMNEAYAALGRDPSDVFALYRLAFAAYFAGRKDLAMHSLRRAAALEPDNPWTMGYLGFLHGERDEVDRAIAWWERGVRVDPKNAVLHYLLGLAYTRKGDVKRAAMHFALAYRDRTLYEYVKGQRRL
jgi:tetratricopeptide (TPR) repeat protein